MKKGKTKKVIKTSDFTIKKYQTELVEMEVTTQFQSKDEGEVQINILANFKPSVGLVKLSNFSGLSDREISLSKVRAIAKGLNNLVEVIERQEKLRELAEGFGRSMEDHKENK